MIVRLSGLGANVSFVPFMARFDLRDIRVPAWKVLSTN